MREILMLNPARKKRAKKAKTTKKRSTKKSLTRRSTVKKGATTMAKKRRSVRRRRRVASPAKVYHKYSPVRKHRRRTHNPRRRVRRAASRIRSSIAGMNIRSAIKNLPPTILGMFAARWAAKRFGSEASEFDAETWTWASYLKGALGALIAGFLAQNLRAGWGQKVLEGGITLMAYKVVENELIPRSEWAVAQFGQDDSNYFPSEYVQTDAQGTPFLLGQNGQWYPADERHRLLGDVLEPPGRLGGAYQDAYFGDSLEPPGRLGADDPFAKAFFG